jgi:nucleotide-binding universal stress UspA family protein
MRPTVVVGFDRTPSSEQALVEAGREAAWRGASVTVVHAFHWVPSPTPMTYTPPRVEESLRQAAAETADFGADLLRHRYPGMPVEAKAVPGAPFAVLVEAAQDAELLVVGNRGRGGFTGLLLGSVSSRTVVHAPCPVMVVRGEYGVDGEHGEHGEPREPREPRDTIVAAIDIEDPADELLDFAFAEASRRSARLRVISAWDIAGAAAYAGDTEQVRHAARQALSDVQTALRNLFQPWQAKYPDVRVQAEAVDGSPGAVLTEATAQADLIMAGAHRHGGGRPGVRVGPIAHALLEHAKCPVVIVPRG